MRWTNGPGVPATQYKVDAAATWEDGTSVTIASPADGSNDGVHTITYRSTDAAGIVEPARQCTVRIDTVGPTGAVTLPSATVRSGRKVLVGFRVDDAHSPQAHVVLVVRRRSGSLVKRVDLGLRTVGTSLSVRLRCRFGRGRFVVALAPATADLAGNLLTSATSAGRLADRLRRGLPPVSPPAPRSGHLRCAFVAVLIPRVISRRK